MKGHLAAVGMCLALAGCGLPAAVTVSLIGSGVGYVASLNNVGASYLKWTDDQELVCPMPLTAREACPVAKVRP